MTLEFICIAIRYKLGKDNNLLVKLRQAVELARGARRNVIKLS
jgi:hypothetical protein